MSVRLNKPGHILCTAFFVWLLSLLLYCSCLVCYQFALFGASSCILAFRCAISSTRGFFFHNSYEHFLLLQFFCSVFYSHEHRQYISELSHSCCSSPFFFVISSSCLISLHIFTSLYSFSFPAAYFRLTGRANRIVGDSACMNVSTPLTG